MPFSRYSRAPRLDFGAQFGTSYVSEIIRQAIKDGRLPVKTLTLRGYERLDTLAGEVYGDARYWWILAAASNIGWGLQVPVGTIINVPDLGAISRLIG
jgi:hypothetical protein